MGNDLLQDIQTLQFTDRVQAERLLLTLVRELFPLDVVRVELRPLAVSLNSFNGFLALADGQRLFFKSHTEPDSVVGEYYNALALAEAGYPVITPRYTSTEWGKQLLIYDVVTDPSVFDLAWAIENGQSQQGDLEALALAQRAADDDLLRLYLATLQLQTAEEAGEARIHQLFYHRLTGGRLERFYGPLPGQSGDDVTIVLPDKPHPMREVRRVRWTINDQRYEVSLDDLIDQAIDILRPDRMAGPSVVGHGDAHNGNVFFRRASGDLVYFDPAFAGRHHPLLDLTKPLFHNVFAMWMYFPHEKASQLHISLDVDGAVWHVQHDCAPPPVRDMFLMSKLERVLLPTLRSLQAQGWLQPDWRRFLKAALFCCPFLTMNLADSSKFPPAIGLLGLTMAVEMGAESDGARSHIDWVLDQVAARL